MNQKSNTLKRSMHNRKVAGVCGGFARFFGIEAWLVRVITVAALFFSFFLMVFVYVACWMILDEDEQNERPKKNRVFEATSDDSYHFDIKSHAWQAGEPPKTVLASIGEALDKLDRRIQSIEKIATSKSFKVRREINRL